MSFRGRLRLAWNAASLLHSARRNRGLSLSLRDACREKEKRRDVSLYERARAKIQRRDRNPLSPSLRTLDVGIDQRFSVLSVRVRVSLEHSLANTEIMNTEEDDATWISTGDNA